MHIIHKPKKKRVFDNEEERRDTVNGRNTGQTKRKDGKANGQIKWNIETNERPTRNGKKMSDERLEQSMAKSEFATMEELISIFKKNIQTSRRHNSNDLDIEEFGTLLSNLSIRISSKGDMLLFTEILDYHTKNYLDFYRKLIADINASIILRKHAKDYYQRKSIVTNETKRWNLFASKAEMLNKNQLKEGVQRLVVNLTNEENDFVFDPNKHIQVGPLLTLKELKNDVKDDIPVPLESVMRS
ncbi:hypothetical protein RFI_29996 [Reticulomyxa filosa]|uniref:Uncharacterized protein n=1 Tax=Reticulomyxa filosa TaxID=46433 RepID=X6M1D9_RETFI|nr:hypothetical protein RFI_29996 [Reticulomyxa filosa]|eukprot:ETO07396.1 hypothetical protein RFI_29996 [Reticulomyxa filosa]